MWLYILLIFMILLLAFVVWCLYSAGVEIGKDKK